MNQLSIAHSPAPRRRTPAAVLLLGIVCAVVVVSGCASPSPRDSSLDGLRTYPEDMAAIADCLRDRGWNATYAWGGIDLDVPEERQHEYEQDSKECLEERGFTPDAELTEDQFRAVYRWSVELAACLSDNGWDVPATPTFDEFRSSYDSDPWIPWDRVEGRDFGHAEDACPMLRFGSMPAG